MHACAPTSSAHAARLRQCAECGAVWVDSACLETPTLPPRPCRPLLLLVAAVALMAWLGGGASAAMTQAQLEKLVAQQAQLISELQGQVGRLQTRLNGLSGSVGTLTTGFNGLNDIFRTNLQPIIPDLKKVPSLLGSIPSLQAGLGGLQSSFTKNVQPLVSIAGDLKKVPGLVTAFGSLSSSLQPLLGLPDAASVLTDLTSLPSQLQVSCDPPTAAAIPVHSPTWGGKELGVRQPRPVSWPLKRIGRQGSYAPHPAAVQLVPGFKKPSLIQKAPQQRSDRRCASSGGKPVAASRCPECISQWCSSAPETPAFTASFLPCSRFSTSLTYHQLPTFRQS